MAAEVTVANRTGGGGTGEEGMIDLSGIPADLAAQAVILGREPAWPPGAARRVIDCLRQSGTAVLGIELWVAQGEHPFVLPWYSCYQVEFTGDWQDYVEENARRALADLSEAEQSEEVPSEVLVNLTWINREDWDNLR